LSKACVVDDVMHGYESSKSSVDVDDNYEMFNLELPKHR
jgi:hypothetical protein